MNIFFYKIGERGNLTRYERDRIPEINKQVFRLRRTFRIRDDEDNPPNLGIAYVYLCKATNVEHFVYRVFDDSHGYCKACADNGKLKLFVDDAVYDTINNVIKDKDMCSDCEESYSHCNMCNSVSHNDDMYYLNDDALCESCYDRVTFYCDGCNETHHRSQQHIISSRSLRYCQSCFEDNGTWCQDCDNPIHIDDARFRRDTPYCSSCYTSSYTNLHDYSYKPDPVFHRDKSKEPSGLREYYGIEVELENGELSEFAESVEELNQVYLKRDGSLCDETGVEIVSHPMTPAYMRKSGVWKKILERAKDQNMEDTDSTGMHVHVGRKALTKLQWWKLAIFMDKCSFRMFKMSKRESESIMNQWAMRPSSASVFEFNWKQRILDKKRFQPQTRYCMLNPTENTVEFRMFASTTDYKTFMSRIYFIEQMLEFVRKYGIGFMMNQSTTSIWDEFKSFAKIGRPKTAAIIQEVAG